MVLMILISTEFRAKTRKCYHQNLLGLMGRIEGLKLDGGLDWRRISDDELFVILTPGRSHSLGVAILVIVPSRVFAHQTVFHNRLLATVATLGCQPETH